MDSSLAPPAYPVTRRNKVKRRPERGSYDLEVVHGILDAAMLCHIAYVIDGQPYCTPTAFWRHGNILFWHASSASRMLRAQAARIPVCVTVTHVDALVLSRCAFGHSINYRSAMLFGNAALLTDRAEKLAAMESFVDRFYPGRSKLIRPPSPQELKATGILAMPIEEASAKIRALPVHDDKADLALPVWAGLIPVRQIIGEPEGCGELAEPDAMSPDLAEYRGGRDLEEIVGTTTKRQRHS